MFICKFGSLHCDKVMYHDVVHDYNFTLSPCGFLVIMQIVHAMQQKESHLHPLRPVHEDKSIHPFIVPLEIAEPATIFVSLPLDCNQFKSSPEIIPCYLYPRLNSMMQNICHQHIFKLLVQNF